MANDLNQCNFIGRLGKDVDMRYMPSGEAVASFSLAVGSQWKDKQGEKQESTEWVNVTAFGKTGEICGQYLKKGSQVFVTGRMKTEKWTDKDGADRYTTKIICDRMQMIGGKSEQANDAGAPAAKHTPPSSPQPSTGGGGSSGFDDLEDGIPF